MLKTIKYNNKVFDMTSNTEMLRDAAEVLHTDRLNGKYLGFVNGKLTIGFDINSDIINYILVFFEGDGVVIIEAFDYNDNEIQREVFDTHAYLSAEKSRDALDHMLEEKFGIKRY